MGDSRKAVCHVDTHVKKEPQVRRMNGKRGQTTKAFNAAFLSAPPRLSGKQPQKQKLPNEPIFRFQIHIDNKPLTANLRRTNTKNEPIFLSTFRPQLSLYPAIPTHSKL